MKNLKLMERKYYKNLFCNLKNISSITFSYFKESTVLYEHTYIFKLENKVASLTKSIPKNHHFTHVSSSNKRH